MPAAADLEKETEAMSVYPFLVFLHVLGAMGLFAAIAIEAVALGRVRQADAPAGVREGMAVLAQNERLGGIAMLTLIASGAWMMATTWGHQWWIASAFIGIIGMGVAGGAVSSRRIRRLRAALAAPRGTRALAGVHVLRRAPRSWRRASADRAGSGSWPS
jgi:hypothetical protein